LLQNFDGDGSFKAELGGFPDGSHATGANELGVLQVGIVELNFIDEQLQAAAVAADLFEHLQTFDS